MASRFKEGLYELECRQCGGEGRVESSKDNKLRKCKNCAGEGKIEIYVYACYECSGNREVECDCTGGLGKDRADDDCYACSGSGVHICPACNGYGFDYSELVAAGVIADELDNSID